jgi:hypothetical protein
VPEMSVAALMLRWSQQLSDEAEEAEEIGRRKGRRQSPMRPGDQTHGTQQPRSWSCWRQETAAAPGASAGLLATILTAGWGRHEAAAVVAAARLASELAAC